MANTYSQVYVQLVFAVQGRFNLVSETIRCDVEKYISGIISNRKSKPISIFCNPDHIHILVGLNPDISISGLVRDIKSSSSKWINNEQLVTGKFAWQEGYGAFTYGKSQLDKICKYIYNQPIHHQNVNFKDEYIQFLEKFEIEYDNKFLFHWADSKEN